MGVSIITEPEGADGPFGPRSVFYCNTSGVAFGPVLEGDKEKVCGFQLWMMESKGCPDPRRMDAGEIGLLWAEWEDMTHEDQDEWIERAQDRDWETRF